MKSENQVILSGDVRAKTTGLVLRGRDELEQHTRYIAWRKKIIKS